MSLRIAFDQEEWRFKKKDSQILNELVSAIALKMYDFNQAIHMLLTFPLNVYLAQPEIRGTKEKCF